MSSLQTVFTRCKSRQDGNSNSDLMLGLHPRHFEYAERHFKRTYSTLANGIDVALGKYHCHPVFLTLTSSNSAKERFISSDFKRLVTLLRKSHWKHGTHREIEFFRLATDEGNGVLHILYYSHGYEMSYIPFFCIQAAWLTIHNSYWINIKRTWGDCKGIMKYLVGNYLLDGHHLTYYVSQSRNWIFPNWRRLMLQLIRAYGFADGIASFKQLLSRNYIPLFHILKGLNTETYSIDYLDYK